MKKDQIKNINIKKSVHKKEILIGIVGFALGVLSLWVYNQFAPAKLSKNKLDTSLLYKVESILQQKYNGNIDYQKMSEGAASGAVASLGDPYTVFLDEKANKELANDLSGELSGIGVEVGEKNGKLTVIAPIDGTPAANAGLKAGDFIAAIDGTDSHSLTIDEAVNKIRGEKGTKVKLVIVRGSEQPKELEITRDIINVPSVSYELKQDNIGYIKIRRFGDDTAKAVREAGASLRSQGAKAIVLDVRDNPGGYLQSAVEIASEFYSDGVVVEERSKNSKTKIDKAIAGGTMTDFPVVVLINGGSASASEILAGALNDNKKAILVGEKSYGKGSVQEVICLNSVFLTSNCNGASLKVTVANWYTPAGVNISKEGIKPQVEVRLTEDDSNNNRDPQLDKALETAKQSIK
jgi:carboxyl-terminal processing protease